MTEPFDLKSELFNGFKATFDLLYDSFIIITLELIKLLCPLLHTKQLLP
jgi:hypothetical protein